MADTTNPINPATSTTSANATTNNDLPVINLDSLQGENTQTTESKMEGAENTSTDTNSVTSENIQTENAQSEATPTAEDPFEGLNIVLGDATSKETVTSTTKSSESFVDPFLNPKKSEIIDSTAPIQDTNNENNIAVETSNDTSGEPLNLDAMLNTIAIDTNTTTITNATTGLSEKKRKMIMIGSGVIGMVILLAASYFVFTTMYPSGTELSADINGPQGIISTGSTGSDNSPDPITSDNEYMPGNSGTTNAESTTTGNTDTNEEEFPNSPADSFGSADELPAGINDTTTQNTGNPTDSIIQTGSATGDSLPLSIDNNKDTALQAIATNVDKAKQALVLAKAKNDNEAIKKIALALKDMRTLKADIEDGFESYSTEIEPGLTKSTSTIDSILTQLIGN